MSNNHLIQECPICLEPTRVLWGHLPNSQIRVFSSSSLKHPDQICKDFYEKMHGICSRCFQGIRPHVLDENGQSDFPCPSCRLPYSEQARERILAYLRASNNLSDLPPNHQFALLDHEQPGPLPPPGAAPPGPTPPRIPDVQPEVRRPEVRQPEPRVDPRLQRELRNRENQVNNYRNPLDQIRPLQVNRPNFVRQPRNHTSLKIKVIQAVIGLACLAVVVTGIFMAYILLQGLSSSLSKNGASPIKAFGR